MPVVLCGLSWTTAIVALLRAPLARLRQLVERFVHVDASQKPLLSIAIVPASAETSPKFMVWSPLQSPRRQLSNEGPTWTAQVKPVDDKLKQLFADPDCHSPLSLSSPELAKSISLPINWEQVPDMERF